MQYLANTNAVFGSGLVKCVEPKMSCTIPSIRPKVFPHYDSKNSLTSSSSSNSNSNSDSNFNSISNSNSAIVKKRRTQRGRPHNSYSKAIAAFYTIYPRLFPDDVCPLVKIKPRSPAEKTELLQELPALLSKLKEAEEELPLILSNFNHLQSPMPSPSLSESTHLQSPLPSPSLSESTHLHFPPLSDSTHLHSPLPSLPFSLLTAHDSPGFDPETEEDTLTEESFLEVSDFEGGMDTILGGLGNSCVEIHSPEGGHRDSVDPRVYDSAIRGLKRNVDGHVRLRSRFKGKLFPSEPSQPALSLKLDYQQVLTAWSGRGSLYIDDARCPNSEDEQDCQVENVEFGLVPDVSIWRGNMNSIESRYMNIEDGSRTVDKNAGVREARVLRYKEKRQTRLFSKKIRYEVRKLNAEKRPRMKGRFVKR